MNIYGIDCRFSLDTRLRLLGLLLLILSAVILIVFNDKFCRNLAALDRKISAELAPKHDENDGTEVKQEPSTQPQTDVKAETTVKTVNVHTTDSPQGRKSSMVAEPQPRYPMSASAPRFPSRHPGI